MKPNVRYLVLGVLLGLVWLTQLIPALATFYSQTVYPCFSYILLLFFEPVSFRHRRSIYISQHCRNHYLSDLHPPAQEDTLEKILLRDGEYLLWVYVWFYLAWGLNYSQKNFYQRTEIPYTAYTPENFQKFVNEYITRLNRSYTPINSINRDLIREETVRLYKQLSDSLGVHRPPHDAPRVKTMMFTPFISMVGVTGSMGPFFCEFTLNGDLLPANYPATYAHELAHLLGITSEAEANFYAYQVCTRSQAMGIRFSGYFSVLNHVLGNAQRLLPKEEYAKLLKRIRPEIIELAKANQTYWAAKYSPVVGAVQDWIYDLYLKGNKIESGRRNYSEVIGLLISYQEWKNR